MARRNSAAVVQRGLQDKACVRELVDYLERALVSMGFLVHRYDAKGSCSCYLKLDWGLACSVRVSDHSTHYPYRFQIGPHIKEKRQGVSKDGNPMLYYPADAADDMLAAVEAERAKKVARYGNIGLYRRAMKAKGEDILSTDHLPRFYSHYSTQEVSEGEGGRLQRTPVRKLWEKGRKP